MVYLTGASLVASKLMKKIGWSEGSGIGKTLQSITAPIEVCISVPVVLILYQLSGQLQARISPENFPGPSASKLDLSKESDGT